MALSDTAKLLASLDLKDNFSKGIASAERSLGSFERRLGKTGQITQRGLGNAARNIERAAAVGIAGATAAVTYSIGKAIEWESAVAGVNKTLDATPDELKAITDGLVAMSTRTPTAAADLAAIAEQAGALGIAKEDVLAFTETVSLIGTTTDVAVGDAATALGQLGNVLKLRGDDYDNFASTLVDLGNKGASTEAQILEITRRAGASANLIGLAKDASLGWASAVANLGVNAELGGTTLQNFFLKSLPLFTQGNKTLQKITGQSAAQLKRSFKQDASGALESFLQDLGDMPKDQRLKAVQTLFGKGSGLTRVVLGLADSIDRNLTPSLDTASEAWRVNEAAAAEAEKRYKTTESQLAILKNNVDSAAITIGSELLPIINELGSELVGWLQTHQGDVKQFGKDLANGIRDAVKWARSLDWNSIAGALKAGADAAKGIIDAFMGLPDWAKQLLIGGFVANKFTGGAIGALVTELGKGLIKGVLGMTAGVVNITAAVVKGPSTGVPGAPGSPGTPSGGARPAARPTPGGRVGRLAGAGGAAIAVDVGELLQIQKDAKNQLIKGADLTKLTTERLRELQAQGLDVGDELARRLQGVQAGQRDTRAAVLATKAVQQSTRGAVLATKSAVTSGTSSTSRNLDQVQDAIARKKLQVRVNQNQRQSVTAIATALANSTGAKAAGGKDDTVVRRTSSQLQNIDRYLASGAVGIADRATPAIFGEAGREAFAILRNPRQGMLGSGGEHIVNVTVNIDPRRVTKKQASSGIYKTYVAT